MIEKGRVHGLANGVIAPEGKRNIADATADFNSRQRRLDLAGGFDESECVLVVFFDSRANGENRRIHDNVGRRRSYFFRQDAISSSGDGHFAFGCVGLAFFVEGHHHHAGSVAPDLSRLFAKNVLALFQAYGIDDSLALQTFQGGFDHAPFRAVHQNGHARDIGFGSECIQKSCHALF